DIAQPGARTHRADAFPHALVSHVDQAAGLDARLADIEHAAAIAVVAVLEHALARNAVAHLVIDRRANGFRKRLVAGRRIVERRGYRTLLPHHVIVAEVVQLAGGDAGLHVRADEVEHFGGEAPGDTHPLELFGGLR